MAEFKTDIRAYLQAGYPALFLRTIEPDVAEEKVREAVRALDADPPIAVAVWKITTGLLQDNPVDANKPLERAKDLFDALDFVEDHKDERGPVVAMFHHLRHYIQNPANIQKLIDTIMRARLKGSHVILIGPHCEFPPELRNLITVIEMPLPTQDQLEGNFRKMAAAYADEIDLPKNKEARDELLRQAAVAAVGLDGIGAENAFSLSLALHEGIDLLTIQYQKQQEVKKSDVLEFFPHNESLGTLGGFAALKEWLARRRRAFTEEARAYGLPFPKGFLVVGPAGTGKSLCVKVTAGFYGLPLLQFNIGKIFRSLQGESEAAVRSALQVAEAVAPCILWLDEIEKGMAGMAGSGELDSGTTARVVSTILTWRQETSSPVLMLATANNVATLPSMVYRKGRLDEVWATDLPTDEERQEIFKIHLKKRGRDHRKFNTELLSVRSKEFVGAEIEAAVVEGMYAAFDDKKEVTDKYILRAISETIPQAQRDREELNAVREWVSTRARLVSGGKVPGIAEPSKIRKIHPKKKEL